MIESAYQQARRLMVVTARRKKGVAGMFRLYLKQGWEENFPDGWPFKTRVDGQKGMKYIDANHNMALDQSWLSLQVRKSIQFVSLTKRIEGGDPKRMGVYSSPTHDCVRLVYTCKFESYPVDRFLHKIELSASSLQIGLDAYNAFMRGELNCSEPYETPKADVTQMLWITRFQYGAHRLEGVHVMLGVNEEYFFLSHTDKKPNNWKAVIKMCKDVLGDLKLSEVSVRLSYLEKIDIGIVRGTLVYRLPWNDQQVSGIMAGLAELI